MYDKDIREPLFDFLDEKYGKNRIFEEKQMGRSRADIIMIVENEIIGFEIKSDADTYERLKRQAKDYNKFCDRNYIVVGKSHIRHVSEHIPKEWGIICVQERDANGVVSDNIVDVEESLYIKDNISDKVIEIMEVRAATNGTKSKIANQIKWMWRPELCRILAVNKLPKYKQKSKKFVQDKLLEKVEEKRLKAQMIDELFERDYTLWNDELEEYKSKQD